MKTADQQQLQLQNRFRNVQTRIGSIKNPDHVRLIAVSKTQSSEKIRTLFGLGQKWFGENYYNELARKYSELKDLSISWSYIGTLQSNKISKIVPLVAEIQTVASTKHARLIDKCGKKDFPVFIDVNIGGEASKSGVTVAEFHEIAKFIITDCPNLYLAGVFSIPPPHAEKKLYFELRSLADQTPGRKLSLGMSQDLELALECGSDIVRIGSDVFGPRITDNID